MTPPPTPSATQPEDEQPRRYAVRFTPRASRELLEAMIRLEEMTGDEEKALEWHRGARAAAATLAENPRRFAMRPEESKRLQFDVHRFLYQRTANSPGASTSPHHLYYRISEGEDSDDGPLVIVFHVRHAAAHPLTAREARTLRGEM